MRNYIIQDEIFGLTLLSIQFYKVSLEIRDDAIFSVILEYYFAFVQFIKQLLSKIKLLLFVLNKSGRSLENY